MDFLSECCELRVDIAIRPAALFDLCQQLLQPKRGNRRVVIKFSEIGPTCFLDELAVIRVDPRFIEESLDLSVEFDREPDADTRVFYDSTVVRQTSK